MKTGKKDGKRRHGDGLFVFYIHFGENEAVLNQDGTWGETLN